MKIALFTDRSTYTLKDVDVDNISQECSKFFGDGSTDFWKYKRFMLCTDEENEINYYIIPDHKGKKRNDYEDTTGKFVIFVTADNTFALNMSFRDADMIISSLRVMTECHDILSNIRE